MAGRTEKTELARRLAAQMNTDEATAAAWIDAFIETLYESLKSGECVTLKGLGGFYVEPGGNLRARFIRFRPAREVFCSAKQSLSLSGGGPLYSTFSTRHSKRPSPSTASTVAATLTWSDRRIISPWG
jgi:nucleoid DNA-binding protein